MDKNTDTNERWVQIFCRGINDRGRTCGSNMGDLNLDGPSKVRLYCRTKHKDGKRRLEEFRVDSEGAIFSKVIPPDVRMPHYESPVILTE